MNKKMMVIVAIFAAIVVVMSCFLWREYEKKSENQTVVASLQQAVSEQQDRITSMSTELSDKESNIEACGANAASMDAELDALKANAAQMEEEIATLTEACSNQDSKIILLTEELSERTAEADTLRAAEEEVSGQIASINSEIDEKREIYDSLNNSIIDISAQITNQNDNISALESRIENLQEDTDQKDQEITVLMAEAAQKTSAAEAITADIADQNTEIDYLTRITCRTADAELQEAFLRDMAEGVRMRNAESLAADSSGMTTEERMIHYRHLVDIELSRIEQYDTAVFPDETLNTLAHQYIGACQIQRTAVDNYKNSKLYNSLWDGGYYVRCAIISELYMSHGLPITADIAASYIGKGNGTTTTTTTNVSVSGDVLPFTMDNGDVSMKTGDLTIEDAKLTRKPYGGKVYGEFQYVVRNKSAHTLNTMGVKCNILDKDENILGTTSGWVHTDVASGKSAACKSSFVMSDYPNAAYLVVTGFYYDGNRDSVVHELSVESTVAQRYILKIM